MTTPQPPIPTTEPERTKWVRYQLSLLGVSMTDVSRMCGLERSTARKVFERRYPAIEQRIAQLLSLRPEQIWPERYAESPHVAGHTTRRKHRKNTTGGHSAAGEVAP